VAFSSVRYAFLAALVRQINHPFLYSP
jgi:hypothetical protein